MDWSLKSAYRVLKMEDTPSDSFYVYRSYCLLSVIKGKVGNLHNIKLKENLHNINSPKELRVVFWTCLM